MEMRMRRFYPALTTGLLMFLGATSASAVPETFLYVGTLEETGAPADGTFSVVFQIFDAPTGGTKVFEEFVASLSVVDGLLVHELGLSPSDPLDAEEWRATSTSP